MDAVRESDARARGYVARRGRLDCETPATALSTFCDIAGIEPEDLLTRFDRFDFDAYCRTRPFGLLGDAIVYRQVLMANERAWQPVETCWFHATRVPPSASFTSQGIRPLPDQIGSIWSMLRALDLGPPSASEWEAFRRSVEHTRPNHWAHLYRLKLRSRTGHGPFAFLIREELLNFGQTPSHDYFRSPEIVEDICICYRETFGRTLLGDFQDATKPAIIKFVDDREQDVMSTVAHYLYRHRRGEPDAFDCNTCFDGKGRAIAPDRVIGVEWPVLADGTGQEAVR